MKRNFIYSTLLLSSIVLHKPITAVPSAQQQNTIYQLTSIFENSTPVLQYDYVENIGDQRGYTFGFIGFTSGTYDGTMFLKEYQRLNPTNVLVKYIPAFEKIDAGPHDSEGRNPSVAGLDGFPQAFKSCASDPAFVQAQRYLANRLYVKPSQINAAKLGSQRALTYGQLYDAYINHGEDGAKAIIKKTIKALGGAPKDGIDEVTWLGQFLTIRLGILNADPVWAQAADRVRVYQTLIAQNNTDVHLPITLTCYGDTFTLN